MWHLPFLLLADPPGRGRRIPTSHSAADSRARWFFCRSFPIKISSRHDFTREEHAARGKDTNKRGV